MILYPTEDYYRDSVEEREKLRGIISDDGVVLQPVRCPHCLAESYVYRGELEEAIWVFSCSHCLRSGRLYKFEE